MRKIDRWQQTNSNVDIIRKTLGNEGYSYSQGWKGIGRMKKVCPRTPQKSSENRSFCLNFCDSVLFQVSVLRSKSNLKAIGSEHRPFPQGGLLQGTWGRIEHHHNPRVFYSLMITLLNSSLSSLYSCSLMVCGCLVGWAVLPKLGSSGLVLPPAQALVS